MQEHAGRKQNSSGAMPRTYLFYDTETTGLNVAFDQVLRFAAIRTDEQLHEVERAAFSIRLRPDVIPTPGALVTTGLSVADLQEGSCEFEAMGRIHALFNTPGTVTAGYNILGYDDELLRFSFYRNFLAPYNHLRQGRIDLLPMTIMVRLFRHHWLNWPETDGKPNLKLSNINRENNLAAGRAHDAMADVEATLALARRYRRDPKEWAWLTSPFDKAVDSRTQASLPTLSAALPGHYRLALIAKNKIGAAGGYIAPVVSLGRSIPYSKQTYWLRLDRNDLQDTDPDNFLDKTYTFRKKDGDDHLILSPPPNYEEMLGEERWARMNENIRMLEARPNLLEAIAGYYQNFSWPVVPNVDADADLYSEFPTPAEEAASFKFRSASLSGRAALLSQMPTRRFSALALRALGRNYPEALSPPHSDEFAAYMRSIHPAEADPALIDYRSRPRFTPRDCLAELSELSADPARTPSEQKILIGLKAHLDERFSSAAEVA